MIVEDIAALLKNNLLVLSSCTFLLGFLSGALLFYARFQESVQKDIGISPETREVQLEIFVDLAGAVANPGIYSFSKSARIADLLKKSGGVSREASEIWLATKLNLSEKLSDGEKIYVPFEWEVQKVDDYTLGTVTSSGEDQQVSTSAGLAGLDDEVSSGATVDKGINVNTASAEELESLVGIGVKYAQKIIDNRPYKDYDNFVTNSGIPKSTADKIREFIVF